MLQNANFNISINYLEKYLFLQLNYYVYSWPIQSYTVAPILTDLINSSIAAAIVPG